MQLLSLLSIKRILLICIVLVVIHARYTTNHTRYESSTSGKTAFNLLITNETQTKGETATIQNGKYTIVLPKGVTLDVGDLPRVETDQEAEYTRGVLDDSNRYLVLLNQFFMRKRLIVQVKGDISNDPYMGKLLVSGLLGEIAHFQRKIRQIFTEILPPDHAFVISSMFIGGELRELSKERADAFRASGLAHILSASGYNILLVSSSAERVFRGRSFFSRSMIFVSIWTFAFLAALSPSVVRAATTRSITYVTDIFGRSVHPIYALILGTTVMIYIQPLLIHSLSLWLSVTASFGIMVFSNKIGQILPNTTLPVLRGFREDVLVSISASLGVLPIQLLIFHQINPGAPIWNGLVGWSIGPIMALGLGVTLLQMAGIQVGAINQVLHKLVDWMFFVAEVSKEYIIELS